MSDLIKIDKIKFEKLFGMPSGYVLDFTNSTFDAFVTESIGLNIWDKRFDYGSGSKANRLRAFWQNESNYNVGKLMTDMLEYFYTQRTVNGFTIEPPEQKLYDDCIKISERLKLNSPTESLSIIVNNYDYKDFINLEKSIRESIQQNKPENALDRLHTFLIKYIRNLCDKHSIPYTKEIPLHSLFGGYIKYLKDHGMIESEMTERILKSSISVVESFNDVRNNKSYAHDNIILNFEESILILNDISNIMNFIESIERKNDRDEIKTELEIDDLPF